MSIKVMTWAWSQDVEARDKLVLMALADHADDDGICWPGIKGVAAKNRISERAVQRHLANLQEVGLLTVTPQYRLDGSRTTNLYQIQMTPTSPPSANLTTHGDINDTEASRKEGIMPQVSPALVTRASPPSEPGVTGQVTRTSPLESPSESPKNRQEKERDTPTRQDEDTVVWPDWYGRLWDIPGFKTPLKAAQAWLEVKGISVERAEETAYALKSKWPGPIRSPYRDVWATFQNWCKRPPLDTNGSGPSRGGRGRLPDPSEYAKVTNAKTW